MFYFQSGQPNHRSSKESSIEYITRPNSHITIPVMIHFDRSLTDRLVKEHRIKTRKKLKDISRHILKEVEANFRHPSLNQSIHFSLLDTKFLRKRLEMNENGSEYLKNYCTRQGYKKKDSRRWWYSVLLTGLDLFYLDKNGKEVRSSTGNISCHVQNIILSMTEPATAFIVRTGARTTWPRRSCSNNLFVLTLINLTVYQ